MNDDTTLTRLGVHPKQYHGAVNPPVMRGSTMVFPNLAALDGKEEVLYDYGIYGTDTAVALREALLGLEGGYGVELVPSGLASISTVLLAFLQKGDHLLVPDNAYHSTRRFCDGCLLKYGVETEYFDPAIGSDIKDLLRDNTKVIWLESPGSLTFEVHDTPAIVAVAKDKGIITVMDNTWSGGYYYKPLAQGVDVSIQAGTKYIGGHSDILLGTIVCADKPSYTKVHNSYQFLGMCVSPDDIYLALRGLRSMGVRLERHNESGLVIADYLSGVKEVVKIMHPGREGDDYHDLWKRDFTGSCGLFGFVMECVDRGALASMVDGLEYFDMGYSWGGFGSLILPTDPRGERSWRSGAVGVSRIKPRNWDYGDGYQTMRIHVGLESVNDLIKDLEKGFERLRR